MSRKTDRVVIDNQARAIIAKVYDFMKKEAVEKYAEKLTDARWRTAQAVGVSERTVTRILHEKKHGIKPSAAAKKKAKGVQSNKASSLDSNKPSTSFTHQSDAVSTAPKTERRMSS